MHSRTWDACSRHILNELATDGLSMRHITQEVCMLMHTGGAKRAALHM